MNSNELTEAIAFESIHLDDAWYQMANICASVFNASGNCKKAVDPNKFLPRIKVKKNAKQLRAIISQFSAVNNRRLKE